MDPLAWQPHTHTYRIDASICECRRFDISFNFKSQCVGIYIEFHIWCALCSMRLPSTSFDSIISFMLMHANCLLFVIATVERFPFLFAFLPTDFILLLTWYTWREIHVRVEFNRTVLLYNTLVDSLMIDTLL